MFDFRMRLMRCMASFFQYTTLSIFISEFKSTVPFPFFEFKSTKRIRQMKRFLRNEQCFKQQAIAFEINDSGRVYWSA
jgi:hypothetical protein